MAFVAAGFFISFRGHVVVIVGASMFISF